MENTNPKASIERHGSISRKQIDNPESKAPLSSCNIYLSEQMKQTEEINVLPFEVDKFTQNSDSFNINLVDFEENRVFTKLLHETFIGRETFLEKRPEDYEINQYILQIKLNTQNK